MKAPFSWDIYSDQPVVLKDKAYKKNMRRKQWLEYLKTLITALGILPLATLIMRWFPPPKKNSFDIGLCVNFDKTDAQYALVEELGVTHLHYRFPLWEIDRLDEYVTFLKGFGEDKEYVVCILQDREHIENSKMLDEHVKKVFEAFSSFVGEFQIGNAINRAKWGFFSTGEYLKFFQQIQAIRNNSFPHLKLLGPSVIDFEYHHTARALFNAYPIYFDKHTALLYVDRRGAPSNTQLGFNTARKIDLLYALCKLSSKTSSEIYITEVNWPLSHRAPYAPTSEKECVSEEVYAQYLYEYIQTAKHSGKVRKLFWHQLIAPGYGLVDNRGENLRKMAAFDIFKKVVHENFH